MVGIDANRVLTLIHKITVSNISNSDLNLFIAYTQSLSKACLINEIQHGRLDLNQSLIGKNQLDDFALDCIAELFARDEEGQLYLLKRFFDPQIIDLEQNPGRVIPVLRKLIASRVHQSLIALFSRVDQGGWKIWRNLSLVSKRQENLHEFSFLGKTYLYFDELHALKNPPNGLLPQVKPISDELLREQLQASMKKVYGLPQSIGSVLKDLRNQEVYQQFLSRGHIFYILKELMNINFMDVEEIESIVSPDPGFENMGSKIGDLIKEDEIYSVLHEQLEFRYVDKGKIESELCEVYHGAYPIICVNGIVSQSSCLQKV